jgi:hypothetical protein
MALKRTVRACSMCHLASMNIRHRSFDLGWGRGVSAYSSYFIIVVSFIISWSGRVIRRSSFTGFGDFLSGMRMILPPN